MIVGVNKYKLAKDPVEILEVDNVKVRDGQIARLQASRPRAARQGAGRAGRADRLRAKRAGNLLALSIQADPRLRATVGEVSAMRWKGFCSAATAPTSRR